MYKWIPSSFFNVNNCSAGLENTSDIQILNSQNNVNEDISIILPASAYVFCDVQPLLVHPQSML